MDGWIRVCPEREKCFPVIRLNPGITDVITENLHFPVSNCGMPRIYSFVGKSQSDYYILLLLLLKALGALLWMDGIGQV